MTNTINKERLIGTGICLLFLFGYCLIAGLSLFIPLLLSIYAFHLVIFRRADTKRLMHVALLFAVIVFAASAMMHYTRFSPYYIPVASIPMLAMLLFSELPLAFSMSLMASALVVLMAGTGVDHLLISFTGGLVGAYAIRNARTRGTVLRAGLFVGIAQGLGYFLFHPQFVASVWERGVMPFVINGLLISAGIVIATLKVFEYLFEELTNFSLLELSDSLNQPLLKRLAFEAPGTYHHSLVLSNIAGAAADAIGANQLLVRVGSYYHDIGKLVKPEYFAENQMMASNKHDVLEPSMSRLVILNHVKEGAEIARKDCLSQKIVDFIEQHHGTSLMHYFYQKALETDGEEAVEEQNYRYPGPRPQTREVAIVMLADSVEGATRAIEEHSPVKIEEVVRRVINNKFIDGQLDECSLTLREIEMIGSAFARVLSAMYHVRVKYPNLPKKSNGH
ncbi:MAG: HDIG domain-containing protein [Candidatus Omnitrophica bacterium]|nr:HDIG domain-containing protein [Candidatus Omnitrophota bacterium]